MATTTKSPDPHAVRDLVLYAENDFATYERMKPIAAAQVRKVAAGQWNPRDSVKAWRYAADFAAQRYTKDNGDRSGTSFGIFSVADRDAVAAQMRDAFVDELEAGEYDEHDAIPKKYAQGWAAARDAAVAAAKSGAAVAQQSSKSARRSANPAPRSDGKGYYKGEIRLGDVFERDGKRETITDADGYREGFTFDGERFGPLGLRRALARWGWRKVESGQGHSVSQTPDEMFMVTIRAPRTQNGNARVAMLLYDGAGRWYGAVDKGVRTPAQAVLEDTGVHDVRGLVELEVPLSEYKFALARPA